VAFTYLRVKFVKCFCLLPVVLVLVLILVLVLRILVLFTDFVTSLANLLPLRSTVCYYSS